MSKKKYFAVADQFSIYGIRGIENLEDYVSIGCFNINYLENIIRLIKGLNNSSSKINIGYYKHSNELNNLCIQFKDFNGMFVLAPIEERD
jgi:hypothetical protein